MLYPGVSWAPLGGTRLTSMADSIHVHIGQCGIQLGTTYWSNMDVVDSITLPCVAVDSEIKPAANLKRCLCGLMGGDNIILDRKGYGNWSCGYSSTLVGRVLERVRIIAEEIGSFNGLILTHSYAGGTGSGSYCWPSPH